MSIEAMKQALEALELMVTPRNFQTHQFCQKAYDDLRQAIEQAEKQEPVAWDVFNKHGRIYFAIGSQSFPVGYTPEDEPDCSAGQAAEWYMDQLRHALTRLATPQPQREWVGLTDEEVVRIKLDGRDLEFVSMTALRRFAKDIEAKLKEKNT